MKLKYFFSSLFMFFIAFAFGYNLIVNYLPLLKSEEVINYDYVVFIILAIIVLGAFFFGAMFLVDTFRKKY